MIYNIKKNKNLIISSSILAGINCNNIYCGCLCGEEKNKTTTGDGNNKPNTGNGNNNGDGKKKDETPNEDKGKKIINFLLKSLEDKKDKLKKIKKENELKITEEQIKNIKDENDFQNVINELNKFKFPNKPKENLILNVDNIPDLPYILKTNNTDNLKYINFIKYINDDIIENNDEKIKEITGKLRQENNLFYFIKYDPLMFDEDKNKQKKYNMDNSYLLYIDKDTFNIEKGFKLGEFTKKNLELIFAKNNKILENCYFLFNDLSKEENIITVFKKKTFIDLDNLGSYQNIFKTENLEPKDTKQNRFKDFVKGLYNVELNDVNKMEDFIMKNSIIVRLNNGTILFIFKCTIDEIEFVGYKKSTTKPDDYVTINPTKKFEIPIPNSKGDLTIYYFVKEEAK